MESDAPTSSQAGASSGVPLRQGIEGIAFSTSRPQRPHRDHNHAIGPLISVTGGGDHGERRRLTAADRILTTIWRIAGTLFECDT